jgi:mono/diheme cytochrome c family protein
MRTRPPLPPRRRPVALLYTGLAAITVAPATARAADPAIDYNRQVRPILSNNCFQCHGPDADQREAGLRLDVRDAALAPADSGKPAIVPGQPEASGLVRRIFSTKKGTVMPPPSSHKSLTDAEKQLLRDWIARGAPYQTHWSFLPPKRPPLPAVRNGAWVRNPIDRFILARLEAEGLSPSPEADRATLVRRLSLDLTGLPPTGAEVDAFLADGSPDAYGRLVDQLLSSPHFGERLALDWLDAARFADTHGFHIDSGRDMTRWRDWVIDAFNRNLPFDRFTVEQIAGDLLPRATLDQRVASGFNRNHMISFEGGAIPEEYHTAYVVDRVNTTGTVWLGLTVGCAQCHDHKYDPIAQKEFYQLYAFFNNVPELGLDGRKGNAVPMIPAPRPGQVEALNRLDIEVRDLVDRIENVGPRNECPSLRGRLDALRRERAGVRSHVPTAMVMQEMPKRRDTFILVRGAYDKPGEKVQPDVPSVLPPLPDDAPRDRLTLARWLVDPAHPMVGRVTVNRFWQTVFGTGIVKTSEDFGSQGEPPSHPELLDWLAVEFTTPGDARATGWDVKRLVRLIVTSATYCQRSSASPRLVARDPENRLLARGPRVRLPAELLRDQALAVSGLLNPEIGGESVSPYQPPGLWEELMSRSDGKNWSAQVYVQSHGKDLYRRTMYTFWKRTSPPPSLATFDAPDRETCTVRRARTNTPLQALVLMNDPTYVEAARNLAGRVMAEAGPAPDARISLAFRLCAARRPTDDETAVLRETFEAELSHFRADRAAAAKLLSVGESPRNPRLDPAEHAAWTTVASVILNLDEVLNKN